MSVSTPTGLYLGCKRDLDLVVVGDIEDERMVEFASIRLKNALVKKGPGNGI